MVIAGIKTSLSLLEVSEMNDDSEREVIAMARALRPERLCMLDVGSSFKTGGRR